MRPSILCPGCGRIVGTYANGRRRPHYREDGHGLCPGAYTFPEPPSEPSALAEVRPLGDAARELGGAA